MTIISRFISALGVVSAFLFLSCSFVIVFETIMRYLGSPTSWAQDFAVYFMIVGAYLCQGSVMLEDGHVRVDFFIEMMGHRIRDICVRVTLALSLAYIGAMAWHGAIMALRSFHTGKTSTGLFLIKMWIPESAIPIGFALLFVATIIRILKPKISTMGQELDENLRI